MVKRMFKTTEGPAQVSSSSNQRMFGISNKPLILVWKCALTFDNIMNMLSNHEQNIHHLENIEITCI